MELIHGGDWAGYETEYGKAALDLSANISPLGMPAGVREAAVLALEKADRYPDPLCRELREALSAYHGVPKEKIVCGNGAADLIYRLCRAVRPGKSAVFSPGFAEYELALREENSEVCRIVLSEKEDFRLTVEKTAQVPEDCQLLFLCNPNNPTGLLTAREILLPLLRQCEKQGTVLAVDECFLELCGRPEEYTLMGELSKSRRLVILKAFTKTYAMAGLRLGYALCSDTELSEKLQKSGQPWAVSCVAEAAGKAALTERTYVRELRSLLAEERQRMTKALRELGLRVIEGQANYLLFFSSDRLLAEKLRNRGILIRDCSNYPGLSEGWYRTALRTKRENSALLIQLREVLHG